MEDITDARDGRRVPIQENRVKREAKRLADWTGCSLSKAQEITARALEATSWQALLKDPTFVPDEHLPRIGSKPGTLEAREAHVATLLATQLHVCPSLANLIRTAWQPTAMRPTSHHWISGLAHAEDGDRAVICDLGDHPALPQGTRLVLVENHNASGASLQAVAAHRLCRFVSADELSNIILPPPLADVITQDWKEYRHYAGYPDPRKIVRLAKALKAAKTLSASVPRKREDVPALVSSSWLRTVPTQAQLWSLTADHRPWRHEDFPSIKKSHRRVFWAMTTSHVEISSMAIGSYIFHNVELPGRNGYMHSQVQAGVGGLRFLQPKQEMGLRDLRGEGHYLVKYGDQPRSNEPIPGMDTALAVEVRTATGMGEWRESHLHFYSSDSGWAYARWAATFPRLAGTQDDVLEYLGPWRIYVTSRMEFELIRANLLP
jgi:hypothetical protein